jgi:septum formation protein
VLDKAGSYAIQEEGHRIVDLVEGSMSNVIGLPMEALRAALDQWGTAGA